MIVVWGTRLYGKVDHVPGLFYVSTHFFYAQFIPLFPTSTYLILDGTEGSKGFQGVKIPMSGKSVLVGYLRAVLTIGSIALVAFGGIEVGKNNTAIGVGMIVAGLIAGLALLLSYKLTRPSPQRALRLAAQAGIEPEVVAKHFVGANLLKEGEDLESDYREHDRV